MKVRSLPRPIAVGIERYLAFDDFEVEREFRDEDNHAAVGRARLTAILAIVLSLPFAVTDLLITQESAWLLVGIRVMAVVGFFALIAAAMWWKSAYRYVQWIACGATAFYA